MEQATGKYERQKRYKSGHKVTIRFDLYDTNNADMIRWLEQQPSMAGYLKSLIRADMDAAYHAPAHEHEEDA